MTAPVSGLDPSTPLASPLVGWWAGLSRTQRVVVAVLALVVGTNVALVGLRSAVGGGNPGGPISSSYSTGTGGLEGFADLARVSGHRVTRLEQTPEAGSLSVDATVVVADPEGMTEDDYRALVQFVVDGGRLVVAGPASVPLVQGATASGASVVAREPVDPLVATGAGADVDDVLGAARTIAGDQGGRWTDVEGFQVSLADPEGRPVIISAPAGEGTLVALADADPLHNAHLATADNAALALQLIGGPGRPVLFVESVHGFSSQGVDALPSSWKWTAAGLVLALAAGLWWAGSRLGPPEPQTRPLRPARLEHVRAVAADLERVSTAPADLVGSLIAANRSTLADRLGVPPDAAPAVWQRAADAGGLDPAVVEAGTTEPHDLEAALYVGALAAHHQRVSGEPVDPLSPTDQPGTVAGPEAS